MLQRCFFFVFSSVGKQLTLIKAFRKVFRLANEWYTLGLLLNVPKSSLSTIRTEDPDDRECLRETLKVWLKQTDSPPTWHELAKVVEPFDRSNAQEIRQRYSVGQERYEEGMNLCVCCPVADLGSKDGGGGGGLRHHAHFRSRASIV